MAYPHILRICAETQQLSLGLAPQRLFDDRLQSTFIAQVAGAEVSVEADPCGSVGFRGPIGHVANSLCECWQSPVETNDALTACKGY
jgi:hypothetical protein